MVSNKTQQKLQTAVFTDMTLGEISGLHAGAKEQLAEFLNALIAKEPAKTDFRFWSREDFDAMCYEVTTGVLFAMAMCRVHVEDSIRAKAQPGAVEPVPFP